jgi:hypothetical protein
VQPCGELRCSAAGFKFFALFELVSGVNIKKKPPSSVPDGMPVVSATIPAGEVAESIPAPPMQIMCPEQSAMKKQQNLLSFSEELQEH